MVAKRSRSASTCSSMSASVTSTSSTLTDTSARSGRVISGRTSTSAVNASASPSSIRVTSISGWPMTGQVRLGDRLAVLGRHRVVDHLGEDGAAAEPGVQDAGRHLARAEPGNPHLAGEGAVGLVEMRFELVERNLDGELHPGRVQVLDGALHVRYSSGEWWRWLGGGRAAGARRRVCRGRPPGHASTASRRHRRAEPPPILGQSDPRQCRCAGPRPGSAKKRGRGDRI